MTIEFPPLTIEQMLSKARETKLHPTKILFILKISFLNSCYFIIHPDVKHFA